MTTKSQMAIRNVHYQIHYPVFGRELAAELRVFLNAGGSFGCPTF